MIYMYTNKVIMTKTSAVAPINVSDRCIVRSVIINHPLLRN
ncbi:hypothetical protein CNEO3_580012 [Clostridium neonatale]|nr:hypothetical protein CNEO2_80013 [Clostridium neonatale]CAI3214724.1 hypothetical protein CNEO2_70012 [Clostridium neonatale]CAI3233609.1 hypothetical protein CNEO2_230013 [Clostridium neonatale]CAI3233738.1 hypothetical protein CNEO2_10229 [Clostridium neonatale]CAI3545878.1 hypothetical protein CNEO3_280049 [Clostridium neonatale]